MLASSFLEQLNRKLALMINDTIKALALAPLPPGGHGPIASMGVPWNELPTWDELTIVGADAAVDDTLPVDTELVLGPARERPLALKIPLLVADMSFGSLSLQAKVTLARGAQLAGTAACSGEGGILPEEITANSRFMYELGTAEFGFYQREGGPPPLWPRARAFHFKGGQAAKTGTGGHLPAEKVTRRIAETRGTDVGKTVISPPTFEDLRTVADFQRRVDHVKEQMGDVPIGFKLSANRMSEDIAFALAVGADYIILDGRGGSTGAAPTLFRDNISIPTIPALVRARQLIDRHSSRQRVQLIVAGGLRVPTDFVKALALGADGVALANTSIQAIGCIGARRCHANVCPAGIATQDPLYALNFNGTAQQLANTFLNATAIMQHIARRCGHSSLRDFNASNLRATTLRMARLTGLGLADDRG